MNCKLTSNFLFLACTVLLLLLSDAANAAVQEPLPALQFFKMVFGLILVVGMIVLLAWVWRRFGHNTLSGRNIIQMESILPLGSREKLVIIRTGERRLLLGVTTAQIQTLAELDPDTTPVAETDLTQATGFAGILQRIKK